MLSPISKTINTAKASFNKAITSPISFRNDKESKLERAPQKDVLVKEKKGLSTTEKFAIGLGITTIGAITLASFLKKKNISQLKKENLRLFNEKIQKTTFPKDLQYKKAETVEEGRKFAQEVLGIKEVDTSFTLDAINSTNRDLVFNINKHNGEIYMPTALRFRDLGDKVTAHVKTDINKEDFLELWINKKFYDRKFLTDGINVNVFKKDGKPLFDFVKLEDGSYNYRTNVHFENINISPTNNILKLLDKYYQGSEKMSIEELRTIQSSLSSLADLLRKKENYPRTFIDYINKNQVLIKPKDIEGLSESQLKEFLNNYLKEHPVFATFKVITPSGTLYHEMGHLQDIGKNLKNTALKDGIIDYQAYADMMGHKDILKKFSEAEQKDALENMPIFKDFIENKETQRIAANVSDYATSGRGEFIAEVYSGFISGKKYSDEIMNLYKKYNGPLLPGM